VLRELVRRERNEKQAQTRLFAELIGGALGVAPERLQAMLDDYAQELHQSKYRPSMIGVSRRKVEARARRQKRDEKLLEKVEALTVKDEDLPQPGRSRRRRR